MRGGALVAGAVALCAFALPVVGEATPAQDPERRYIVVLDGSRPVRATAERQTAQLGSAPGRLYRHALSGYTTRLTAAEADRLARMPGVVSVEVDVAIRATEQTLATGVDRVSLPATAGAVGQPALADQVDDRRVNADVAVIDSGVAAHPDLYVVSRTDCTVLSTCKDGAGPDQNGHGTHVAGIAAAVDNGAGTVGVAPGARLWSVRVLGADGSGKLSWLVAGIDWVTRHADVIDVANISVFCGCTSTAVDTALGGAVAAGVTVAVAAGNADADASAFSISNHPEVLTVSALADFDGVSGGIGTPTCRSDVDDTLADFSSWGAAVDLVAPGVCIVSSHLDNGTAVLSGTSMASPHVAGAAALLTSDAAYAGQPSAVRQRLLAEGTLDWVDDSGDGIQEPLLDVSGIVPVTTDPVTLPQVRVSDAWVVERPAGSVARFEVSTDRALLPGEQVEVVAATKPGTAKAGSDFVGLGPTRVVLTPGQERQTLEVTVMADDHQELNETFTLGLSDPLGGTVADGTGLGTVVDPAGPLTLAVADVTVPEPVDTGQSATVQVRLSAPVATGQRVTTKVSSVIGSAKAGSDYGKLSSTLVFDAGEQVESVEVGLLPDTLSEGTESFTVKLASTTGAAVADGAATVTILDDEDPLYLSVSDVWLAEGDSGSRDAVFVLRLSAPPQDGQTVGVTVATANGSAGYGSDYARLTATRITFDSGVLERQVGVPVYGDTAVESDETFRLNLSKPTQVVLSDFSGTATIANDDGQAPAPAPITVAVSDTTSEEAGFGSPTGTVWVTLSTAPGPGSAVSVTVETADLTATAGTDYLPIPPTVISFGAGETAKPVELAVLDDTEPEGAETFALRLSAPVGAVLADDTAVVTIQSDEPPINASVGDAWLLEADSGTSTVEVPVALSQAPGPGKSVSVVVWTVDGTATAGSDYTAVPSTTLLFGEGQALQWVPVTVHGDTAKEGNESFTVRLSATGIPVSDPLASGTIADEEGPS